jgi:hypothetical protein
MQVCLEMPLTFATKLLHSRFPLATQLCDVGVCVCFHFWSGGRRGRERNNQTGPEARIIPLGVRKPRDVIENLLPRWT